MDSLTYHYYANTNQLQRINDSAGGSYTTDLKDQGSGNNYTYDLNGQLKQDVQNGVSAIDWTVYGKIDTIVNSSGTIVYTYDAAGNRITKSAGGKNTIYVRDAQGNILAIYTQSGSSAPLQTELDVYGSSRLGSIGALTVAPTSVTLASGYGSPYLGTFSRGEKSYELTNHLGNVLSTITDKKIAVPSGGSSLIDHFMPDIATAQDYYPFGMLMPGRAFTASSSSNYRFGFNGKENDNEVKGTGNEIDYGERIFDSRVGRFLSIDPLTRQYPFYTPYQFSGNTPIQATDLDGKEPSSMITNNGRLTEVMVKLISSSFALSENSLRAHRFYWSNKNTKPMASDQPAETVDANTTIINRKFQDAYPAETTNELFWLNNIAHETTHGEQFRIQPSRPIDETDDLETEAYVNGDTFEKYMSKSNNGNLFDTRWSDEKRNGYAQYLGMGYREVRVSAMISDAQDNISDLKTKLSNATTKDEKDKITNEINKNSKQLIQLDQNLKEIQNEKDKLEKKYAKIIETKYLSK